MYAGAWLTLGFVACPYNFLVFSVLVVPAVPFLYGLARGGPSVVREEWAGRVQVVRGVLVLLVATGIGVGSFAYIMHNMMASDDSQMSSERVDVTRHRAPYVFLEPGHVDRYTAFLADYIAVGKPALIEQWMSVGIGQSRSLPVGSLLARRKSTDAKASGYGFGSSC